MPHHHTTSIIILNKQEEESTPSLAWEKPRKKKQTSLSSRAAMGVRGESGRLAPPELRIDTGYGYVHFP